MGLFKPRSVVQVKVMDVLHDHMRDIHQMFGNAKLTLVIRSTDFEDPVIVTNDEPAKAIEAIRSMTRPTVVAN